MATLAQKNFTRWNNCHIPADKGPAFKRVADALMKPENRRRYEAVAKTLAAAGYNIPWWFIAVTHYREAGLDKNGNPRWDTYLGNGQSLKRKTTIVPKGRGPFNSWEEGAVDALVYAPPYAAKNKDWSIGGALAKIEEYNGLGYAGMDKPSPYVWAGTDQYDKGKYVADHVYDPNHVDTQLGCAGILKFMGVFKTAPTGAGTATGAVVAAGGAAVAASSNGSWAFVTDHWMALLLTVIGIGLFIDFAIAIYNNEKNQLNVTTSL